MYTVCARNQFEPTLESVEWMQTAKSWMLKWLGKVWRQLPTDVVQRFNECLISGAPTPEEDQKAVPGIGRGNLIWLQFPTSFRYCLYTIVRTRICKESMHIRSHLPEQTLEFERIQNCYLDKNSLLDLSDFQLSLSGFKSIKYKISWHNHFWCLLRIACVCVTVCVCVCLSLFLYCRDLQRQGHCRYDVHLGSGVGSNRFCPLATRTNQRSFFDEKHLNWSAAV